jgi:hypothetical protein
MPSGEPSPTNIGPRTISSMRRDAGAITIFGEGHYDESEWQAVTHLVIFILTNSEFLRNLMRGRRHDSAAGWSA